MDKQEFNQLNIASKIEYFNIKLNEGQTVTEIRKDIGLGEKSWQKEVKLNGYKYDIKLKNYISVTGVTQMNNVNDEDNLLVVDTNISYKDNLNVVVTNEEYKRVIKELQDIKGMYSKFERMYQWYELQQKVVEKEQLRIEANDNDIVTRSFKVYGDVYKEFMQFCNEHKEYKVQQLVSQAFKELVERYK